MSAHERALKASIMAVTLQMNSAADSAAEVSYAAVGSYLSALYQDDWVAVPREPTYEMCRAGGFVWERPRFPNKYKAMLDAAPSPHDKEGEQ